MPEFIPGLELSRLFYWEVVRPLLDRHYPGLPHAAALIGPGSEVLGFDNEMSMDHHWYPNVQIFLREIEKEFAGQIHELLRWHMPPTFMDFPLNLEEIPDEPGTYLMKLKDNPPINHKIHPLTVREFKAEHLALDHDLNFTASDWLSTPTQILRSITSGALHYDSVGELTELRTQLEWYPHDVWLYLLAAGWQRIGEEEHLMPRAGHVGDELGSGLIAARLVRDIMSLCFLMENQYAPYPKWFGSAFQQLGCARDLSPILQRVLWAETWQLRETLLSEAYQYLAGMHNGLGLTHPMPELVSSFHDRPFKVIRGDQFAAAILKKIRDKDVLRISQLTLSGGIDQISDNTKIRSDISRRYSLVHFYAE
jgi:hypothetical protein